MKKFIALFIILSATANATFNATMQWEVRTTGSDSNTGGFDSRVAIPGTNYAMQDSPQVTYTDLIVQAATNTVRSALSPFATCTAGVGYCGNTILITGTVSGSCTNGTYEVFTTSTITATLDRAAGTAASVCNAILGGGKLTIGAANTLAVSQNVINVRTGTYTVTSAVAVASGVNVAGYSSSWGDTGTATVTTSTNGAGIFSMAGTPLSSFKNLVLTSTAGTPGDAIIGNAGGAQLAIENLNVAGFANGINGSGSPSFGLLSVYNSSITSNSTWGINTGSGGNLFVLKNAHITGNGGTGTGVITGGVWADMTTTSARIYLDSNIISANAGVNVRLDNQGQAEILNNDISYATGTGSSSTGAASGLTLETEQPVILTLRGNIFYGNAGWGAFVHVSGQIYVQNNLINAYGGNPQGSIGQIAASAPIVSQSDIALSADPFVAHSSDNYALNTAGSGGALLRGSGYPGTFLGSSTTGHLDVGAVQSSPSAGAGVTTTAVYGQ